MDFFYKEGILTIHPHLFSDSGPFFLVFFFPSVILYIEILWFSGRLNRGIIRASQIAGI